MSPVQLLSALLACSMMIKYGEAINPQCQHPGTAPSAIFTIACGPQSPVRPESNINPAKFFEEPAIIVVPRAMPSPPGSSSQIAQTAQMNITKASCALSIQRLPLPSSASSSS
ncbi:hypothetical protein PGT21_020784 [Puccinia graminis f. sp. tritici]|uniref:Secreted protein n=1 Tax=Puccinia graminis f. sp. tritici TaxID=56615 RepID=A0A5B0MV53_PUCGR|nr:hypothetical protein PGT21_020784 [Puccinia graminis f. sp. tritici]